MFDAVLNRDGQPSRRLGRGAIFSVVAHVVVLGCVAWFSARQAGLLKDEKIVDVALVQALPPPPPPPPPPPAPAHTKKVERHIEKKPDTIVEPKEALPEPTPTEEPPSPAGEEGGVEGGVAGGVAGGVVGGVVGNQLQALPFGAGMARPTLLSGQDPELPKEALVAKVEGLIIVKCMITIEGTLQNCRIIKGLPFMEQPVLKALATRRYTPVTYQGKVVAVDYTFNIKIVQPH